MKRSFLLYGCFVFALAMLWLPAAAMAEPDEDNAEGDENPWGAAAIDHKLNVGWEYPSDYIKRPLVYNKRVIEFGVNFQYKYAHDYWDDDAKLVAGSFKSKKETFNFFFGGGISDNFSASINFPFVYKKTIIYPGNQNYRNGRKNTYGYLGEEAVVDFFDHSDPWKLWEADLPQLGDVKVWLAYQVFKKFDPYTTSIVVETAIKWPTGNDNPRRTSQIRNYMTSGQTDWYIGVAAKQQAWKFSFDFALGYNYRMPADTKYSPGEVDLADQVIGEFELAFQIPEWGPLSTWVFPTWALVHDVRFRRNVRYAWPNVFRWEDGSPTTFHAKESTITNNDGSETKLGDAGGYALDLEHKIVFQVQPELDVYFGVNIPVMGKDSFLTYSRSYYLPPYEIEGNEGVGITYTLGVTKRWQ
jgi:hypothetical protein